MPLSLLNHSALALFAQRTRIPTSARSIGFCAIWVCISSSSSKSTAYTPKSAGSALVIGKIVLTMLVAAAKINQTEKKRLVASHEDLAPWG